MIIDPLMEAYSHDMLLQILILDHPDAGYPEKNCGCLTLMPGTHHHAPRPFLQEKCHQDAVLPWVVGQDKSG